MASYVFFYMAGLYPVPATTHYLLSSPYFPSVSFYNPLFKTTTTIKANNFQGNPSSGIGTVYIKVNRIPHRYLLLINHYFIECENKRHTMEIKLFYRLGNIRKGRHNRTWTHGQYYRGMWGAASLTLHRRIRRRASIRFWPVDNAQWGVNQSPYVVLKWTHSI